MVMHGLKRFFAGSRHPHRLVVLQTLAVLITGFMIASADATVVIRFQNRSLHILNSEPGVITDYTVSLTYTTETTVGSLLMEFCTDPMHTEPCVMPNGLDLSGATLLEQTGVDDYTMSIVAPNKLVFSRTPAVVGQTPSMYKI